MLFYWKKLIQELTSLSAYIMMTAEKKKPERTDAYHERIIECADFEATG